MKSAATGRPGMAGASTAGPLGLPPPARQDAGWRGLWARQAGAAAVEYLLAMAVLALGMAVAMEVLYGHFTTYFQKLVSWVAVAYP